MSGGHFDYCGLRIQNQLEEVAAHPTVTRRWPRVAVMLAALGQFVYDTEHEIDWDMSGDTSIGNDAAFEAQTLSRLKEIVDGMLQDKSQARSKVLEELSEKDKDLGPS